MSDVKISSYDHMVNMLNLVSDSELKFKLLTMHQNLKDKIEYWPAAISHHHKWKGGYADHVKEVMLLGISMFNTINSAGERYSKKLNFTLDDVIIVCYVHDIDKLWRYKDMPASDYRRQEKYGAKIWDKADGLLYPDESAKVVQICAKNGIILTDEQIEAVSHHHLGFSLNLSSVYSYEGSCTGLAALVGSADMMSGTIFGKVQ